jgi:hypothetical protein
MVLKNVARDVICQEVQTVSLIEQPNSQGKLLFCNWLQPLDCDALHGQWIMSSHNKISYPEGF